MKRCVCTVSDGNYVEQTKFLVGALRKYGQWTADILLISNGLTEKENHGFIEKGVKILKIKPVDYNWAKVNIFHDEIKKAYDRILYMDQDMYISKSIEPLFAQEGDILSDSDAKPILREFKYGIDDKLYSELRGIVGDNLAFCAGIIRYDSSYLPEDILTNMEAMRVRFSKINMNNGVLSEWVDQPILNVYFSGEWEQFEYACFWGKREEKHAVCHCTNWYAPWNKSGSQYPKLFEYYQDCLKYYREVL